ncbi:MAG TPA: RebB family R body protein [Aliidongia sp.]|nr:RebB family R body protein [Aliidongia sp.]
MAFPTAVNNQITDSVSQSSVTVLGDAPGLALASLYQTMAQATGLALQNAVANQQSLAAVNQAATAAAVALLTRG